MVFVDSMRSSNIVLHGRSVVSRLRKQHVRVLRRSKRHRGQDCQDREGLQKK
jgi:hypothetical protein